MISIVGIGNAAYKIVDNFKSQKLQDVQIGNRCGKRQRLL